MAVKPQGGGERKPYDPIPPGEHAGVLVDVYYSLEEEVTWKSDTKLKDFVHLAVEFDTAKVPERDIQGVIRPAWLGNRWAVNMERLANELWAEKVHKVTKPKLDKDGAVIEAAKDLGLYKVGESVFTHNYSDQVQRSTEFRLNPEIDDQGEYNLFIGGRHKIYELLLGWGGLDFKAAHESGDVSFEGLVGKNAMFYIVNPPPKEEGAQIYSKIKAMAPPLEGQDLKPSEHYIRIKDREQEDSIPF